MGTDLKIHSNPAGWSELVLMLAGLVGNGLPSSPEVHNKKLTVAHF